MTNLHTKFPKLTYNYQDILDNFDNLTINDFLIKDLELDIFFKNLEIIVAEEKHNYNLNSTAGISPHGYSYYLNINKSIKHKSISKEKFRNDFFIYDDKFIVDSILDKGGVGTIVKYNSKQVLKIFDIFDEYYQKILITQTDTHYIFSDNIFEGIASIYINKMLTKFSNCYYQTFGVYISGYDNINQNKKINMLLDEIIENNKRSNGHPKLKEDRYGSDKVFTGSTIILSELLYQLPDKWYTEGHPDFYYILYIILHNLYILQNTCQFVHGDLHLGNIMSKKYNNKYVELAYENEIILIPAKKYVPVLIDFGHTSFTRNNRRVTPFTEPFVHSGSSYNSQVDLIRLYWDIKKARSHDKYVGTSGERRKARKNIKSSSLQSKDDLNIIYTDTDTDLKEIFIDQIRGQGQSQDINKIFKSIREILNYLLSKITYKVKKQNFNFDIYVDDFFDIIKVNEAFIDITPQIKYEHIIYDTIEPYWKQQEYSKKLNIHMVTIIPDASSNARLRSIDLLPDASKFNFKNKCCRQTVFDFLNNYKDGVAINGTFFNLDTSEYIKYYLKNFSKYLGKVEIKPEKINITPIIFNSKRSKYPNVKNIIPSEYTKFNTNTFLSNPLLVIDKDPIDIDLEAKGTNPRYFSEENLSRLYLYTCDSNAKPGTNIRNCNYIKPGELYHLGNANPRTILAIKDDIVYFIIIIGRTEEFKGASIDQIQDFLINYLHVDNAINLDGGSSSLMMWKKNGQIFTPMDVVERKVISNVIGYVH